MVTFMVSFELIRLNKCYDFSCPPKYKNSNYIDE